MDNGLRFGNFSEGYASVRTDGKYNFVDKEGNILFEEWFDEASNFSEGYVRIKKESKWNFVNKEGNILFEEWLEFDYVRPFVRGFATVGIEGEENIIDKEGNILFEEWFDGVGNFSEGCFEIRKNEKSNFIDKEGNILFEEWVQFNFVGNFSEGYAIVEDDGSWNFVDKEGNILFEEWFDKAGSFSEGYAIIEADGSWNFVDKEGNILFEEWFDKAGSFSEGYAIIKEEGKWNFIDKKGNLLFDDGVEFYILGNFLEGYAIVSKGGPYIQNMKYNFIDKEGNILFEEWFDEVGNFSEGYAIIKEEGKWNFVDKEGNLLFDETTLDNIYSLLGVSKLDIEGFVKEIGNMYLLLTKEFNRKHNQKRFTLITYINESLKSLDIDGSAAKDALEIGLKNADKLTKSDKIDFGYGENSYRNIKNKYIEDENINNYIKEILAHAYSCYYVECNFRLVDGKPMQIKNGKLVSLNDDDRITELVTLCKILFEINALSNTNLSYKDKSEQTKDLILDNRLTFGLGINLPYTPWLLDIAFEIARIYTKDSTEKAINELKQIMEEMIRDTDQNTLRNTLKFYSINLPLGDIGKKIASLYLLRNFFVEVFASFTKESEDKVVEFLKTKYKDIYNYPDIMIYVFLQQNSNISSSDTKNDLGKTKISKDKKVESNKHSFIVNKEREDVKQKVFEKKGYVCSDCGATENLDVHHILPRHMGGKDIISNLKVLCRDCHEKLHGYEIIDDTENKGKGPSKKLILIHKAMDENLKLFIVYKKFDEDQEDYITRRVIDPMELYYENGRQYLKAYCHLRKQQRNFRISRITKIELR